VTVNIPLHELSILETLLILQQI